MESRRYVIITEAPLEIKTQISPIRARLSKEYESFSALAYPLHVTLRTGLIVPLDERKNVFDAFVDLTAEFGPFDVETDGLTYGEYAPEKFLIAYRIKRSEKLSALHDLLLQYTEYRKSDRTDFHPHMTLLFDDLTKINYGDAVTFLSSGAVDLPALKWRIKEFGLYYLSEGKWRAEAVFSL